MDITLKAGKQFTISGRVTDRNGKAIADIKVIAYKQPTGLYSLYLWMGQGVADSKTAQDGSYQLTLEEGKYDVMCGTTFIETFLGRRLTDIDVSNDMTLNITIPTPDEAYEVRGVIKDKKGRGINGAFVSAYDKKTGNFSLTISQRGIYLLVMAAGTYEFTLTSFMPLWQFPEQHIENVVIEGNTIKNITIGESDSRSVNQQGKEAIS